MNEYLELFLMASFGAVGFVIGFVLMLNAIRRIPGRQCRKHQRTYQKQNEDSVLGLRKEIASEVESELEPEAVETELEERKKGGLLKVRLSRKGPNSWTEFNCTCDGADSGDYIKEHRKREEVAYRYAKRKKK